MNGLRVLRTAVTLLSLSCLCLADGGSWSYAASSSRSDPVAMTGGFDSNGCPYATSSSGPCRKPIRRPKPTPSRYRTEYRDIDGQCTAVQVKEEDRQQQATCTCVSSDSCTSGDIEIDQASGPAIAVAISSNRQARQSLGSLIDSMLGGQFPGMGITNPQVLLPGILSQQPAYPPLMPALPGIDVRIGGASAGNGGISVNMGSPGGIRVAIGGPPGGIVRPAKPCTTCGGQPVGKPIRRRVVAPRCPAGQVCCRSRSSTSPVTASIPREGSCGKRNACGLVSPPHSRNGDAQLGEYPWNAIILQVHSNGRQEFLCNAALIDQRTVVTIAQCVDKLNNTNQLQVRLGEYNLTDPISEEPYPHQDHRVDLVMIHPQYETGKPGNDLAILRLCDDVRNNYHISPICLPREGENFTTSSCVVTGWGDRRAILQTFPQNVLTDDECERRLIAKHGERYTLYPSFVCAEAADRSEVTIDQGGVLACRRSDGSYALVGLLSWSRQANTLDLHTDVQNFLPFVRDHSSSGSSRSGRKDVPTTDAQEEEEGEGPVTEGAVEQGQEGEAGRHQNQTQSTTGSSQDQGTSSTPKQEQGNNQPSQPVDLPPVGSENEVNNEDKRDNSFAWSYSSSS